MAGMMSFDIDIILKRGDRTITTSVHAASGLTALFGASGAGKTSVLDAVAGLIRPERGTIVVSGETLFDTDRGIDLPPERRACGYVFQDSRLFPHRTVAQNLLYGFNLVAEDRRWLQPDRAIAFLGIAHLLDRMPRN